MGSQETPNNQVLFAVTDAAGPVELKREFGAFLDELSRRTGLDVRPLAVRDRGQAAQFLKEAKVDFVLTGPAEYVVIRKKTGAVPLLALERADYRSVLAVRADSPAKSPADLKGAHIALGDYGSTSKHLAPMRLLAKAGLDPLRHAAVLHLSSKDGFEALKRGAVDALGVTKSVYESLLSKEPDPNRLRVLATSPPLPPDVLVVAPHVPTEFRERLLEAFDRAWPDLLAALLVGEDNQKYRRATLRTAVADADFDLVRDMYRDIGRPDFAEFLESAQK